MNEKGELVGRVTQQGILRVLFSSFFDSMDVKLSVRESGQRAATVVADLLTWARGAANVREWHNVLVLAREYFDSPECSRRCSLYPKIAIHLECSLENGIILCSPFHIKKCLMNLVTNAMEAIEDKGQVRIAIRAETILGRPGWRLM